MTDVAGGSDQVPPAPLSEEEPTRFHVPWGISDALGTFVLSFLVTAVVSTLVFLAVDPQGIGPTQAALLPVGQVVMAGTVLVWVTLRFRAERWRLRGPRRPRLSDAAIGLGLGVLTYLGVNIGLGLLLRTIVLRSGREMPVVQQGFREALADPAVAPLFIFSAVVLAPLAEELFFRGMLFQALRDRIGVGSAAVVSALVFGLVHAGGGGGLAVVLVVTTTAALGVVFALIFHRRRSLLVPIAAHATINLSSTLLLIGGFE